MSAKQFRASLPSWLRLLSFTVVWGCGFGAIGTEKAAPASTPRHSVTNVAQLTALAGADFLAGCDFRLTGVITLADTNRGLTVLQDGTGAVALRYLGANQPLKAGRLVTLSGFNCHPLLATFPDYPHHPSGEDICKSFEAPMNWGAYNLTRLRGYLHPQVTGEYRFWIASDDSSELWLSTDSNPSSARKIASVARFGWTDPHQWSKQPSQRSDLVQLKAGETYYLEALQEQTIAGEHLSVAWQEPGKSEISVIDGFYLTPWSKAPGTSETTPHGILREYWTNYFNGSVEGMAGPRPYKSVLTVKEVTVTDRGSGVLPKSEEIVWNQPLAPERNYRWVSIKGLVKFKATEGGTANLEIYDGKSLIPVRALHWSAELSRQWQLLTNPVAHVEGVCEGVEKPNGVTVPELIWATTPNGIVLAEGGATNEFITTESQTVPTTGEVTSAMLGYFGTRGVVTFNDRVFDKDYIFIQEGGSAWRITPEIGEFKRQLRLGNYVDVGGALSVGASVQSLAPLFVMDLGLHSMPAPFINPEFSSKPGRLEGKWIELEGVARRVNTNGTLSLAGSFGSASLWIGQTVADTLTNLVDARLRVRGVLSPTLEESPLLLVPSRHFLDVVKEPPPDPFAEPGIPIAMLLASDAGSVFHRVQVSGLVTYLSPQSFFIQDASGAGIRVKADRPPNVEVGDQIAVSAFVSLDGFADTLIEPLIHRVNTSQIIVPKDLNLTEALAANQRGSLVQVNATLLAQKTNGVGHVLELQEQQRVFFAVLTSERGDLPLLLPGSRLRAIGVCDDAAASEPQAGERTSRAQFLSSLKILLRSPEDVMVLSGPPWWTWKRTVTLVGVLLTVLSVALLRVYWLHRRLERQKAAQLAFSRQVLERLEDERSRIAANLHDGLGQALLVIKNYAMLAIMRPSGEGMSNQRLNEISDSTSQAIEEVRRITHGLRPYQLDRLGLTQAIRAAVNRASESVATEFASRVEDVDGLFNKDGEIHIYRIVQEAISNVVKHSGATEAAVVIKRRAATVSLSVRDNGRGFDRAKFSDQLHDLGYGLTGIAERVRILGGTVTIDSRPGAGTNLSVDIPIPISKNEARS